MRHLDLFSGIGGFALAASWVWPDHEVVAFCEIDPWCQKILAKHWPSVPIVADIRELHNEEIATNGASKPRNCSEYFVHRLLAPSRCDGWNMGLDLLTGGFPCQPFSHAGKRRGTEDDRFLWPEMLRVIKEFRPRWIIGENVAGLISMGLPDSDADMEGAEPDAASEARETGVLDRICAEIESCGYTVQPVVIPACAVAAPHRRDRVWIVAHRDGDDAGINARTVCKEAGNIRRREEGDLLAGRCEVLADNERVHVEGDRPAWQSEPTVRQCNEPPEGGREAIREWCEWPVEPEVGRVAHGVPRRVDRLKGLGNAIVPQVAYEIMRCMKEIDDDPRTT